MKQDNTKISKEPTENKNTEQTKTKNRQKTKKSRIITKNKK